MPSSDMMFADLARFAISILCLGTVVFGANSNPFVSPGSYSIKQWDDAFYFHPYENLSYALSIFAPNEDPGTYNVLFFLTGLDGVAPSFFYSDVFSHIASFGNIVVSASIFDFGDVNATEQAGYIVQTMDWISSDLEENMKSKGGIDTSQIKPNTSQLIIASHSSAAHPLVLLLNTSCHNITAVWLQDPVDCTNPYKPDVDCVTTPGEKLPFAVPLLHIETGLDPVPAHKFEPPCAPAEESNMRFVHAWNGPVYQINATMFGHMDICDAKDAPYFTVTRGDTDQPVSMIQDCRISAKILSLTRKITKRWHRVTNQLSRE